MIRKPWPSMLRGNWGDEARYRETYWSKFGGRYYYAGDGARRDAEGYFWMISQCRPSCGVFGVPSYITEVALLASGP